MLFTEPIFFLFMLVCFGVHWLLRANEARKRWLLACSLVFYGAWDWRFLFLLLGQITVGYVAGKAMSHARPLLGRGFWLWTSVGMTLATLGFFKYYNFFVSSASTALAAVGLPTSDWTLGIILPVGISFLTFQVLSYVIDVYFKKMEAVHSFADLALYISFFPQLVAGPIVRAADFLPQLAVARRIDDVRFQWCLSLFLLGFIKKACISNNLAPLVDLVYDDPSQYAALSIVLATLLYAAQIYCDFSGYSEMGIAAAGLLGYELCPNFNYPYVATSVTDFWRRWHMSLSTWLRDYLYIPLGGNRYGALATYRNLFLTMLLGGLWHGASWNFVIWGALHGLALMIHKAWTTQGSPRAGLLSRAGGLGAFLYAGVAWLLTMYWITITWIFFRAATLADALIALEACVTLSATGAAELPQTAWVWIPALLSLHFFGRYASEHKLGSRPLPDLVYAIGFGAAVAVALLFVPLNSRPFIYFQF